MTNHFKKFSWRRMGGMIRKEFLQMWRDKLTLRMMLIIPIMQLILFGFAINTDPKHLPTALVMGDNSSQARVLLESMRQSGYFDFTTLANESQAHYALQTGRVQFVVNIPPNFSRELLRGDRPSVLIEADATDPIAIGTAVRALGGIVDAAFANEHLPAPLIRSAPSSPVNIELHARYNPSGIQAFSIIPGLLGVILTMTMSMITGVAITRERERGTMENLLSTPVRPFEVIVGKIIPYIAVGYIQVTLILIAAHVLFHVPMIGSLPLLYAVSFLFIAANLAVGITFSTLAQNQLQAVQMAFFFFLPSILLSGFVFPFRGMPGWAQAIGSCLPNTHFLRIVRGILLKGNGLAEIMPEIWPLLLFLVVAMTIGVKRYRQTLD